MIKPGEQVVTTVNCVLPDNTMHQKGKYLVYRVLQDTTIRLKGKQAKTLASIVKNDITAVVTPSVESLLVPIVHLISYSISFQ